MTNCILDDNLFFQLLQRWDRWTKLATTNKTVHDQAYQWASQIYFVFHTVTVRLHTCIPKLNDARAQFPSGAITTIRLPRLARRRVTLSSLMSWKVPTGSTSNSSSMACVQYNQKVWIKASCICCVLQAKINIFQLTQVMLLLHNSSILACSTDVIRYTKSHSFPSITLYCVCLFRPDFKQMKIEHCEYPPESVLVSRSWPYGVQYMLT